MISQQVIMQSGAAGQQIVVGGQRMPIMQQQIIQTSQVGGGSEQNVILSQRLQRPLMVQQQQAAVQQGAAPQPSQVGENQEIPDIVTAEIEKLEQEQDEALPGEEVGDILGKLGDDDDELLGELTRCPLCIKN